MDDRLSVSDFESGEMYPGQNLVFCVVLCAAPPAFMLQLSLAAVAVHATWYKTRTLANVAVKKREIALHSGHVFSPADKPWHADPLMSLLLHEIRINEAQTGLPLYEIRVVSIRRTCPVIFDAAKLNGLVEHETYNQI